MYPCYVNGGAGLSRRQQAHIVRASSSSTEDLPGPRNAFVPGQESESRRVLFNRISPVYDEVSTAAVDKQAMG